MSNDDVKIGLSDESLMEVLADEVHVLASMMVTTNQLASSGGPGHGGGVGPHLEKLIEQGHNFDLLARRIDGLVLQLKLEADGTGA